jgi:hypothetical protein
MLLTGENSKNSEKNLSLCPPQIRHVLTANPGLRDERPTTNDLSHGPAILRRSVVKTHVIVKWCKT